MRSRASTRPLPASDADIAFAPVTDLSHWIEQKQITSDRLTRIYLQRIDTLDARLRSVITKTAEHALAQAKQADAEIASGRYRGPLHGIPYGVKDLLDTAGIATTYGAEPFRNRVPTADSAVVRRLTEAGAVLIAKLSLGALALNDIWFGGQTMNPWLIEEGASGSSAGPGSATAAALVAFSIGSETGGSIIAPSMRCGVTGLRPTFGRVPRTGAMTLCWSLDKLGPMTRSVEDAVLVLHAITGPDPGDVSSVPCHLDFDANAPVAGLRVGYFPSWMKENPATEVDRAALELVKTLGMTTQEVTLPNWPPATLPGRKPAPPAPAATAAGNGAAAPNEAAPGPSAEDIAKATAMTPEQRAAFIDSMVKGLADRQKAHPEDIDGWLRLANAYDKLGRADDAFTAWHEAATRAPDRLDTQIAYAAAGAVRAERGAPPADFEATVARLRQLAPDNPLGLYCAGLIAEAHGDKTAAKGFWQKLLPVLPEGSPQRQQIEARIAKLGN